MSTVPTNSLSHPHLLARTEELAMISWVRQRLLEAPPSELNKSLHPPGGRNIQTRKKNRLSPLISMIIRSSSKHLSPRDVTSLSRNSIQSSSRELPGGNSKFFLPSGAERCQPCRPGAVDDRTILSRRPTSSTGTWRNACFLADNANETGRRRPTGDEKFVFLV